MTNVVTPVLLTVVSTKTVDSHNISVGAINGGNFVANDIRFNVMSNGDVVCNFKSVDYDGAISTFETSSLYGEICPMWTIGLVGRIHTPMRAKLHQEIVNQMRVLFESNND